MVLVASLLLDGSRLRGCGFDLHHRRVRTGRAEDGLLLAQLKMGPEVGCGASGSVCLARDVLSGTLYAVKRFDKSRLGSAAGDTLLRYLERERDVLRLMSNSERGDVHRARWVVHMVTSGQTRTELRLVMPACLGGELWQVSESSSPRTQNRRAATPTHHKNARPEPSPQPSLDLS
jgi:serine/threonine protein kinase